MRDYLTATELNIVIEEMKNHDNALEREIVKDAMVAQFVMTEEELKNLGEYEDCSDIYNRLSENKIELFREVTNYNIIDFAYSEDTNIKNDIKDFLDSIEKKLDASFKKLPKDLKNFKMEDFLNSLRDIDKKEDGLNG